MRDYALNMSFNEYVYEYNTTEANGTNITHTEYTNCSVSYLDKTILPGLLKDFDDNDYPCEFQVALIAVSDINIHASRIYSQDMCEAMASIIIYPNDSAPYNISFTYNLVPLYL